MDSRLRGNDGDKIKMDSRLRGNDNKFFYALVEPNLIRGKLKENKDLCPDFVLPILTKRITQKWRRFTSEGLKNLINCIVPSGKPEKGISILKYSWVSRFFIYRFTKMKNYKFLKSKFFGTLFQYLF